MKKQLLTALMMIAALTVFSLDTPLYAQSRSWGNGPGDFIDENGDGFNDLAPDADGDGIPNKFDGDYERPQDGSGAGFKAKRNNGSGPGDGSGYKNGGMKSGTQARNQTGPGDGTGECVVPETTQSTKLMIGPKNR
ncbi:MAG: hypothetical protein K9M49_08885 [Candidatus Marinimicrobia bacterium]|nr:hypothetical protein [Candidatus Neomarinimicrobiota bacterium]MCF7850746.1 hypothetical protein [Candidatus Neomarinimicrobiota bacterium]MCF7905250.1 hypothetical protein [Candidatus Neomarinimicrobiota bacterium]